MNGYYTRRRRCRFCPEQHERFHVCPVETAYRRGCVQAAGLVVELVYERNWSETQVRELLDILSRFRAENPYKPRSWLLHEAVNLVKRGRQAM